MRIRDFFHLGAVIGSLPHNITNGQLIDATPVMADFNWIRDQVNANVPAIVPPTTAITAFTPVLNFGGGTTGITYGTQSGSYVRIGPIIHFALTIVLTSKGSSTGNMQVSGLPFACNTAWPTGGTVIFPAYTDDVTYTGNVYAYLTPGSSAFAMYQQVTHPGNPTILQETGITNTGVLAFSGIYSL